MDVVKPHVDAINENGLEFVHLDSTVETVKRLSATMDTGDCTPEDAVAFAPLSQTNSLPKDTPDYDEIVEKATLGACKAPCEMISCCCVDIELLEEMLGKCSVLKVSDVGCGTIAARVALEAAAVNVFINTRSLPGNVAAQTLEEKAETMRRDYIPRAEKIADAVMEILRRKNNG